MTMDGKDYDLIRNQTLLFFLEHLMTKGQPRTLHDLSCQFGTKGFTREMRTIAGGSQSGLRKFLAMYPSLFTIEGEQVSITSYKRPGIDDLEDYSEAAVRYFSDKMKQYGVGTEVPIRSLLGHRSQAPPEVRHISGQQMDEFEDFLKNHPEVFLVKEDFVILLDGEVNLSKTRRMEVDPTPEIDPQVAKDALAYLKKELAAKGPTIVERLLSSKIPIFSTARDLATFIKMHSDVFEVHSNLVSLIHHSPPVADSKRSSASSSTSSRPSSGTVKDRVNSVLMKTLSENAGRDRPSLGVTSPIGNNLCDNLVNVDPSVMKALRSVRVVASAKECRSIVSSLMMLDSVNNNSNITNKTVVCAIDGQGVNIGPEGGLTLLSMATEDGRILVFDVMVCPELVTDGHLKLLLEDESVVKVMHDCRNDSAALNAQFGIELKNVFDTQSANVALNHQETGTPLHKVKNIGFGAICEVYGAPMNPTKSSHNKYIKDSPSMTRSASSSNLKKDQRYWARRPLTDDMLTCAAFDVLPLVPHLYNKMKSQLKPETELLLRDLCEEQVGHFISRDDVRMKKKARKAEVEMVELREKLAAVAHGKTLVLSNREIRLLRHMDLTDEEKEKLEGSQKVLKKLERIQARNDRVGSVDGNRDNLDSLGASSNADSSTADFPSLDSAFTDSTASPDSSLTSSSDVTTAPKNTSLLTASMQMVDQVLANGTLDRLEKIERIEAALAAAMGQEMPQKPIEQPVTNGPVPPPATSSKIASAVSGLPSQVPPGSHWTGYRCDAVTQTKHVFVDAETQTLSTGEIVITKVHCPPKQNSSSMPNTPFKKA